MLRLIGRIYFVALPDRFIFICRVR